MSVRSAAAGVAGLGDVWGSEACFCGNVALSKELSASWCGNCPLLGFPPPPRYFFPSPLAASVTRVEARLCVPRKTGIDKVQLTRA